MAVMKEIDASANENDQQNGHGNGGSTRTTRQTTSNGSSRSGLTNGHSSTSALDLTRPTVEITTEEFRFRSEKNLKVF
jgi:hypothetical protein